MEKSFLEQSDTARGFTAIAVKHFAGHGINNVAIVPSQLLTSCDIPERGRQKGRIFTLAGLKIKQKFWGCGQIDGNKHE